MADLIIAHGTVITVDPERRIIDDGAVVIEGERIVDIGFSEDILKRHQAREILNASRKAVLPGFIDAHAHAGHGLIKTMGGDNLDDWEKACETAYTIASDEEFWFAEARLAALERLRFGVTTGVSLLGGGDTIMRTDDPLYADAHCRGVLDVGTRSVVAVGPTRPPHPRTYARWKQGKPESYPVSFEDQLETCQKIIKKWHQAFDQRINIALLTPALRDEHAQNLSPSDFQLAQAQTRDVHALSQTLGLLFTQDGHTTNSVSFANQLGILGPDTLLSHATDITDEEQNLIAATATKIAHNPSSNASVSGRCPVPELLDLGVTVALGSDATAPDRSADMFRHMQQAMHYHRRHFRDSSVLPPGKVLEMITIDGAHAVGLGGETGSLETGKLADIILVDLTRPHMVPIQMPAYRVTCFANGNDVETVIVGGKILMQGRKVLSVNEDNVIESAERAATLLIKRGHFQSLLTMPANFWKASRY
jgi:5-methylthioadenosine/S-adenosylhomocysteine deaminase